MTERQHILVELARERNQPPTHFSTNTLVLRTGQQFRNMMIAHGNKRLLKLVTTMLEVIAKESNQPKDVTKRCTQQSLPIYIRCTTDLETVEPFFTVDQVYEHWH